MLLTSNDYKNRTLKKLIEMSSEKCWGKTITPIYFEIFNQYGENTSP